nr:MAG TPA: hypothetical protein [Caudoviricetes sp.]
MFIKSIANSLNCWKALKLKCHNIIGNDKCDGTKVEKSFEIV